MRVAVLASGSGTNLQAMIDRRLPIVVVVADRPCGALEIAERAAIAAVLVERTDFGSSFDRVAYTHRVVDVLEQHDVELIAMAGFGTILEKPVHDAFPNRIVNTHPALLPSFRGWHAVRDALEFGVKVTGVTVHLATLEVDDGPILAQQAVEVRPGDTEETLHERIKQVERKLYPEVIAQLVQEYDAGREPGPEGT
jgi:phosphoribosylglycinamide formyltransferase-1